jgi:hypothetical protein
MPRATTGIVEASCKTLPQHEHALLPHAIRATLGRRSVAAAALAVAAVHSAGAAGQGFPALIEPSSLKGPNGLVLHVPDDDLDLTTVAGVGDVNGDGIDDLVVGTPQAPVAGLDNVGKAYVVFGTRAPVPETLDLSTLDGATGFVFSGTEEADGVGRSVAGGGDVNGDGVADVVVGAPKAGPPAGPSPGEAYVIFGRTELFPAALSRSALDGSTGFVMRGVQEGELTGFSAASADVNGDGVSDVVVGAPYRDGPLWSGATYVVFGTVGAFPSLVDLSALDGGIGFLAKSLHSYDMAGFAVSDAGDLNGDGRSDLAIGAPHWLSIVHPQDTGRAYVLFGSSSGFPPRIVLNALDGSDGFAANGSELRDAAGWSVSGAGDINGDGISDLLIGASSGLGGDGEGKAYVLFGNPAGFPANLELANLDGTNGFAMFGIEPSDQLGRSVSHAADVNADGMGDIVIGAPGVDGYVGVAYVVFGRPTFPAALDLSGLDGSNGFMVRGRQELDSMGYDTSLADVNGDGISDVILSAAAEAYVIFGCDATTDGDCDGLNDETDNCLHANDPEQRDTDTDGIGNVCDGDFNQDCLQNFADLAIMKSSFFLPGDLETDMNGDDVTNFLDLASLKTGFFRPPGPSGTPNVCGRLTHPLAQKRP